MATILLVEDDGLLRGCLKKILEAASFEVEEASNVEEAIQKIEEDKFALVVTDYLLGTKQNGLSLLAYLRTLKRRPPLILISGSTEAGLGTRARELGAHTFLQKPFDLTAFLGICCQALI